MKSKDVIFDEILGKEGGYVNHPDDKVGRQNGVLQKKSPALTDIAAICVT